ncbi:MAG: tetratricopeptide repeat protein [Thermoanaerobaculia bacterium]
MRSLPALCLLGLLLLGSSPAGAAERGFELGAEAKSALSGIQDLWAQWLAAMEKDEYRRASTVFEQLHGSHLDLGMRALPDLALAAEAYALESAGRRQFDRARIALAAAEQLDPGRPERCFAAAKVARKEGQLLRALALHLEGWGKLGLWPADRRLALGNLLLWLLASLLIAGALFVVVEMAVKGGCVLKDLVRFLSRTVRPSWVKPAALLLLVLPIVLPPVPLWLLLIWSIVLWGYGSTSERAVLMLLWLLLGAAPNLVRWLGERAHAELSPPVRAIESVRSGRLYGNFFADVGTLGSLLPENPAVTHLEGDLHRLLGQWEAAKACYQKVLADEPGNAAALSNLGVYSFYRGDYAGAVEIFKRVTTVAPTDAAAWFNLSQAYSQQYLFSEAEEARRQASSLAPELVNHWIHSGDRERLRIASEGLERAREIRALLAAERSKGTTVPPAERLLRWLAPALAALAMALATLLHFARRRHGYSEPGLSELLSKSRLRLAVRELVPGFSGAEVGEGVRTFLHLWLSSALILLPESGSYLLPLPLGMTPGSGLAWAVAGLGLAIYFLPRLARLALEGQALKRRREA